MRSISTDYSQNPQQKAYFYIYFCLWLFPVGVTDCKWRTKPTKCCKVSGLVNKLRQLKTNGKYTEKIAIWERWVVSAIALPTSAPRKRSRCYWETRSNVKGQHAPTRNNQRQKCRGVGRWGGGGGGGGGGGNNLKKSSFVADCGCNR